MAATSKGPGAPHDGTALPVHPRTGLTAVGIVAGKPVWPIKGASPDHGGGEPSGQAPQGDQPPAAPPAQQQAPGQAPAAQQQGTDPQDIASLPEWAQKQIRDLRTESANHRTAKQTAAQQAQAAQQQRDAILKALGLTSDGDDAPPDPEALAAQVTDQQAINWEIGAENAILRVAGAAGANADALLDSTSFLDSLEEFIADDPKSDAFRTKLQAHIKTWVSTHPNHKATTGAARSGGDHPGGGTPPTIQRPTGLGAAVRRRMSGS
ncbi:hypothetical protein [Amycolatopsis eburnea]|uniref:Uncharacterized protein n=1 Tax=Amycolatopsis eburnea TaxID=2267691 RepID=A0A3R9FA26_9PSEU|nr:hypothetical protein [Amycolatopsis eburnea]RSD22002.1 hypothetical protein EIY87_09295 [Amycolatopsis eburnea]